MGKLCIANPICGCPDKNNPSSGGKHMFDKSKSKTEPLFTLLEKGNLKNFNSFNIA